MNKTYLFLLFMTVFSWSCSSSVPQKTIEPAPKLPPTVKYKAVKAKPVGKQFLGKLAGLYSCMIKKTYEYMYCDGKRNSCPQRKTWKYNGKKTGIKAIDKRGVFGAGTSGFFYYGNMGSCLLKQLGKKSSRNFWDLTPLKIASGVKAYFGTFMGDVHIYNKKIIRWAGENLIPPPDRIFMGTTYKKVYHSMLFRVARLHALVYMTLHPTIKKEAKAYEAAMNISSNKDGIKYLKSKYLQKTATFYPLSDDGTFLTGFHVAGFWLRRYLDGTDKELCRVLGKLLKLYDPDFVKDNSSKMYLFY
jgi:hypothetical protein